MGGDARFSMDIIPDKCHKFAYMKMSQVRLHFMVKTQKFFQDVPPSPKVGSLSEKFQATFFYPALFGVGPGINFLQFLFYQLPRA
jgi:hypothetical protein